MHRKDIKNYAYDILTEIEGRRYVFLVNHMFAGTRLIVPFNPCMPLDTQLFPLFPSFIPLAASGVHVCPIQPLVVGLMLLQFVFRMIGV